MDSMAASYSFLLAPVVLLAIVGLITQRPTVNALLLLAQSSFIALFYWLNRKPFGSMAILSLLLLTVCLMIWTATIYLSRTAQVYKPTRSSFSILLAFLLFFFFILAFRHLQGGEVASTTEYSTFLNENIFSIFVVFFTISSVLIAAVAIISNKENFK